MILEILVFIATCMATWNDWVQNHCASAKSILEKDFYAHSHDMIGEKK